MRPRRAAAGDGQLFVAMLEIVALLPENEMSCAEHLRRLIAEEWSDLESSPALDRVRIFVGAGMLFEIDSVVEISLAKPRPVRAVRLREGTSAEVAAVRCGLLAIEVKQQSREQFEIRGTEVFPMYGQSVSPRSVGKQVADVTIALTNFARRYTDETPFVHGLGWLTDMPERELLATPAYIVGEGATWSSLLQAAATRSRMLFTEEPAPAYCRSINTIGDVLARRRRVPPRDRAAVDRLTNATIADGKFDDICSALGARQIRLTGRAGSGKSTTFALLADYVARVRQERLLVLTYHHALCHEIERLIRSVVNDDALVDRHIRVATLVDFLADATAELGGDIPRANGAIDYVLIDDAFRAFLDAEPIVERRAEAEILRQLEPRFAFDYVCVDEAQDCSDAERDLLRVLYPPEGVVLADGMEQLIRRQTPCDWTNGVAAGARLRVELAQSLRMSRNVAEFATAVAREMGFGGWRVTPHPQLSGGRVIVQSRPYDETLLCELVTMLDEAGVPRKDLLICVPPAEIVAEGGRRSSRIGALLESLGFRLWNGCDESVRRDDVAELDQIRIVQYDSMRGLEGWCTLLVGLDTFYQHRLNHPNLRSDDRSTPEQVAKCWLLMAMTRAASTLVITLDDAQSEVAEWLRAASAGVPAAVTWQ